MLTFLVAVFTVIIFLFLLPSIQELVHRFVLVGVRALISKSNIEDGVSLASP